MQRKVAVTDYHFKEPSLCLEEMMLKRVGASLVAGQCKTEKEVLQLAQGAIGIINYAAPLSRRVIERLEDCKIIVRRAVGVDGIDIAAATQKGIAVCNVPDYCIDEVSDHTLAMLLCLQRKLLPLHESVSEGYWDCFHAGPLFKARGTTLGIVGLGRIGRAVARKARCFRFQVIAYDPYVSDLSIVGAERVDFTTLLRRSDAVSFHIPLTKETEGFVGEAELRSMKKTAFLINTSRGKVLDEAALLKALTEKWIAGAGLDVLSREPPDPKNPLLMLKNVLITPHAASVSEEAVTALRKGALAEMVRFLKGRPLKNRINLNTVGEAESIGGRG